MFFDAIYLFRGFDFDSAFKEMEEDGKRFADSCDAKYICYGEIDCPSEMLGLPGVTEEMVAHAGKTNWLRKVNTDEWVLCGDAGLDALIDSGKVVGRENPEFYFDEEDDDGDFDF